MKVLIDADGCPVVEITAALCRELGIPCLILCDTAHEIRKTGAETLVFDKGADSVDYAVVNRVCPGDLIITQDYGLASMCLARGGRVLNQDGWEYTDQNIDGLLYQRYEAHKSRASGRHTKGPKKRSPKQNRAFEAGLRKILQTSVQG